MPAFKDEPLGCHNPHCPTPGDYRRVEVLFEEDECWRPKGLCPGCFFEVRSCQTCLYYEQYADYDNQGICRFMPPPWEDVYGAEDSCSKWEQAVAFELSEFDEDEQKPDGAVVQLRTK